MRQARLFCVKKIEAIHIWEGYFDDIFDSPSLDGKGWKGFTRDYHQLEGVSRNGGASMKSILRSILKI